MFFLVFAQVLQRFRVLFPVAAVEGFDGELRDGRIEAANVDVDAVWVRARDVEGFHPAGFAKEVLRDAGVEGVAGEVVVAGE